MYIDEVETLTSKPLTSVKYRYLKGLSRMRCSLKALKESNSSLFGAFGDGYSDALISDIFTVLDRPFKD